jgi:DNA-binding NarL/FixJ family response regulator
MGRGTLMVARTVMLHPHYKKELESFGFAGVTMTALEREGLYSLIREMNPDILIIEASFLELTTPYMMRELVKRFPELYTAAYSFEYYSLEHAMYFISNKVKSYVTGSDGPDEYDKGMRLVRDKKEYVAPSVLERIKMRNAHPKEADVLIGRELEIGKHICYGWNDEEIADNLYISRKTVVKHKENIFRSLNIRKSVELASRGRLFGIPSLEEMERMQCCHRNHVLTPLPEKRKKRKEQVTNNR